MRFATKARLADQAQLAQHYDGTTRPETAVAAAVVAALNPQNPDAVAVLHLGGVGMRMARQALDAALAARSKRGRPPMEIVDLLFAGPPGYDTAERWSPARERLWYYATDDVQREILGPNSQIVTSDAHRDETSPHVQTLAIPFDSEGRLGWCHVRDEACRRLRPVVATLRTQAQAELDQRRAAGETLPDLPPLSTKSRYGILQDFVYYRVSRPFGLERGQVGSQAKHHEIDRQQASERAAERALAAAETAHKSVRAAATDQDLIASGTAKLLDSASFSLGQAKVDRVAEEKRLSALKTACTEDTRLAEQATERKQRDESAAETAAQALEQVRGELSTDQDALRDVRVECVDAKAKRDAARGVTADAERDAADAKERQGVAETAETDAKERQGVAETAEADAKERQGVAETAEADAKERQGVAETAETDAKERQGVAETAEADAKERQGVAETAEADAKERQGVAETAETDAKERQGVAETAEADAKERQGVAETAEADAKERQGVAETAETDAKERQGVAETAEADAKERQGVAETAEADAKERQGVAETAEADAKAKREEREIQLGQDLQNHTTEVRILKSEKKELGEEITALERQVTSLTELLPRLRKELAELRGILPGLRKQVDDLRRTLTERWEDSGLHELLVDAVGAVRRAIPPVDAGSEPELAKLLDPRDVHDPRELRRRADALKRRYPGRSGTVSEPRER